MLAATAAPAAAADGPDVWTGEFPRADFSRHNVPYGEIAFDGARRDSIPPIDAPLFAAAAEVAEPGPLEPVLSIGIGGDFRAYPLRILLWHEIVNDVVGGVPVVVSYCPLCNSGVIFDRRLGSRVLSFGNTGRLRHYDMVMYDHETESWWQQALGEAIMGTLTGVRLKALPARLESLARFRERAPDGKLLLPNDPAARPYGESPYAGMDRLRPRLSRFPFDLPADVAPFARAVVVGDEAWTVDLLRARRRIEQGDLVLIWTPGQNSIHDRKVIAEGRDVGNVVVRRRRGGGFEDLPYDVSFAFAFRAFHPDGALHHRGTAD